MGPLIIWPLPNLLTSYFYNPSVSMIQSHWWLNSLKFTKHVKAIMALKTALFLLLCHFILTSLYHPCPHVHMPSPATWPMQPSSSFWTNLWVEVHLSLQVTTTTCLQATVILDFGDMLAVQLLSNTYIALFNSKENNSKVSAWVRQNSRMHSLIPGPW